MRLLIPFLLLLLGSCASVTRAELDSIRAELRDQVDPDVLDRALEPLESKIKAQEDRVESAIRKGTDAIPSPFGDILAGGLAIVTALYAAKRAGDKGVKAAEEIDTKRTLERQIRGERTTAPSGGSPDMVVEQLRRVLAAGGRPSVVPQKPEEVEA